MCLLRVQVGCGCHMQEFTLVLTKVPRAVLGDEDRTDNMTVSLLSKSLCSSEMKHCSVQNLVDRF